MGIATNYTQTAAAAVGAVTLFVVSQAYLSAESLLLLPAE